MAKVAETIPDLGGWGRFLDRYGIPAAIAVFLVWWITGSMGGELKAVKSTLDTHISDSRSMQTEIRFYMRQVCLNTAQTDTARANCDNR